MNAQEAEEYTQGLEQSLSGGYRLYAWAQRNGIPQALGVSTEEWINRVGGYIKMPLAERRGAVAELKADGHSNREIAKIIGVGEGTVRNDVSAQNCAPAFEKPKVLNEAADVGAQNCAPAKSDPRSDEDEEDADDEMSPREIAHRAKMAFLLRANDAKNSAYFPPDQRTDREIIKEAESTRDAWDALVVQMRGARK